ncbi:hypothetical protein SASPL_135531 [Salvia splendens]|uniref:SAC domain-containing protein n=1 Tax=Salvia splendens TaxID=180675 RepID=A0A8X8WZT2_SALSN|nr:hypothetical protein SASPL_135531 [Salvia splendens]
MMTDPAQKLYAIMRLWEFLDQYVVEPTDGSSASLLAVSRLDGSMNLVDEIPQCTKLRVPKIQTIYGVVGTLKLLAGKFCVAVNLPEYSSQSVISCFSLPFDTYLNSDLGQGSYLLVITGRECVGSYLGHSIYKVTSLKVFPCDHLLKNFPEEQHLYVHSLQVQKGLVLLAIAAIQTCIFSCSAQRLQDLGDESKSLPLWRQADPQFLWNNYMLEVLIDNKVKFLDESYKFSVGTRMWRRGADSNGFVANFVESEQIIQINGHTVSFIQKRWIDIHQSLWKFVVRRCRANRSFEQRDVKYRVDARAISGKALPRPAVSLVSAGSGGQCGDEVAVPSRGGPHEGTRQPVEGQCHFFGIRLLMTYKPKFEIVRPEEAVCLFVCFFFFIRLCSHRVAERHFLDLRNKYGSVLAVDLVNKVHGIIFFFAKGRLPSSSWLHFTCLFLNNYVPYLKPFMTSLLFIVKSF